MQQRNCCGNGDHRVWSVKCLLDKDYLLLPRFNTLIIRVTREWAQLKNKLRLSQMQMPLAKEEKEQVCLRPSS